MKDILVFLSPTLGDHLPAGAHYALALARAHGAHLSALIAEADIPNLPPEPGVGQPDEATSAPSWSTERRARTTELILYAAKAANVPCEILRTTDQFRSLRERVIGCAQVRDVLIVDVLGPLHSPGKDLIDGALFRSGRPIILVPQNSTFAENRIVLAWDATRSAVRAMHDALPLLVRAREVTVVSVIDEQIFSTPYLGNALCRYLARWNINAKFSAINRENLNIGMTLLAYARRTDANLLVMGGFAHGIERELTLGSATRDIFRTNIEVPVFLSH